MRIRRALGLLWDRTRKGKRQELVARQRDNVACRISATLTSSYSSKHAYNLVVCLAAHNWYFCFSLVFNASLGMISTCTAVWSTDSRRAVLRDSADKDVTRVVVT
jgi:hypothetical protein